MSSFKFLAPRQEAVWALQREGLKEAEIARRLGISRQFVHQTLNATVAKVSKALVEAAQANRIQIRRLEPLKGIAFGYHHGLKTNTIISYTLKHGVQVWFWYEKPEDCERCEQREVCRSYLLNEAEERKIKLSEHELNSPPAKLAHIIFSKLIPEVNL